MSRAGSAAARSPAPATCPPGTRASATTPIRRERASTTPPRASTLHRRRCAARTRPSGASTRRATRTPAPAPRPPRARRGIPGPSGEGNTHPATRICDTGARHVAAHQKLVEDLRAGLSKVLRGKGPVIDLALIGIFAGGHVLLEDVPGVGKTTLAKALARVFGVRFTRVQFTPDLLPGDITGSLVLDTEKGTFSFHRGPVFTNVLLADEI